MIFDVLPDRFQSVEQKGYWAMGRAILPTEKTLTKQLRDEMGESFIESCVQMRQFCYEFFAYIYQNFDQFKDSADIYFYRGVLGHFVFNGKMDNDKIIVSHCLSNWILNRKKAIDKEAAKTGKHNFDHMLMLLESAGLTLEVNKDSASLYSKKFPLMMHVAKAMGTFSDEKSNHYMQFAFCDFRQIGKKYKLNFDDYCDFFIGDDRVILNNLLQYANEYGLKCVKGATNQIHFNFKGNKVMSIWRNDDKSGVLPTFLRLTIYASQGFRNLFDIYWCILENEKDMQDFYYKRVDRCRRCNPKCYVKNGALNLFGRQVHICGNMTMSFNPMFKDLDIIKKLLCLRIESINSTFDGFKPDTIYWLPTP